MATRKIQNQILSDGGYSSESNSKFVNDASASAGVDSSPKYFLLFLILSVSSATLASWKISVFNEAPSWELAFSVLLGLCLFIFFSVFIPMFVRSLVYGVLFALFNAIAFVSFLVNSFTVWIFVGATLFVFVFVFAFYKTRLKIDNWLKILFLQISSYFIQSISTALALFLAMLYASIFIQSASISPIIYNVFLDVSSPAISTIIPKFYSQMPIDQAIASFSASQLKRDTNFAKLNAKQQAEAISQVVPEVKNQIVQITEIPIDQADNFFTYSNKALNGLIAKAEKKGTLPLIGAGVFLFSFGFFKTIFAILRLVLAPISLIVYYLLRSIGIIRITTERRAKEIVLLK